MKFVCLYSGGKDSTFALFQSIQAGHKPAKLLTFISENPESYMFHTPNIKLAKLGAQAMGIPIMERSTKGEKEKELQDIFEALQEIRDEVEMVVAGALASRYQYERVKRICEGLKLEVHTPSWHWEPEKYWNELLLNRFEVMISHVAAEGLRKEWLGKIITENNYLKLKKLSERFGFHLAFEGGEAETLVVDCPLYRKKIKVLKSDIQWDHDSGTYNISKATLVEK